MGRLRDNVFAIALGTLLVSTVLLVVVLGYVGALVYTGLVTGASLFGVVSGLAMPYLPIVAALVVLVTVTTVGVGWGIVRRLSVPKSDRLATVAEHAERRYPMLDGVASLVTPPEPTREEALADLKQRYVAGEIDELRFERELDRLAGTDTAEGGRTEREREAVLDERVRERRS